MKKIIGLTLAYLFFLTASQTALAQDSHYGTYQYGSRSGLMSGAVVGGVRDTSAIFYNPGALGYVDNKSLSVSANAYSYEKITLTNGAGANEALESEEINIVPTLISGIYIPEDNSAHRIGYGILTRNYSNFNASSRLDTVANVLQHQFAPGEEDFIGQYNVSTKLQETWGGVTYAYQPCDYMSVGISNFLAIRTQSFLESTRSRAINRAIPTVVGTAESLTDYDYYNGRLLWKLGAAGESGWLKYGITVTTPSVDLFGDGEVSRDITLVNLDPSGSGDPLSLVANDRQDGLDADFETPLGISAGIEVALSDSTNFGFVADWYDAQSDYKVLSPESRPFLRPTGVSNDFDSADFLQLRNSASSVINFAIGFEETLSEKTIGYFSVRTDNEALNDRSGTGFHNWDIYHVLVGSTFKGENSDLSLGLQYSFARQNSFGQVANFSDASEANFLAGTPGSAEAEYDAITVLLGYTYYIE